METPFAGLYQPSPGDDISANNYQFYENIGAIDQLFQQALTRRYDGVERVQSFASGATLVAVASGGALPAGETFWIGVTALDAYNGETTVMLASATVPGGVVNPTVEPALVATNDGTGQMTAGTYRYVYTVMANGGESEASPVGEVSILTDGTVTITPPSAVTAGYDWRAYRSFGYSDLARVGGTHASGTVSISDNGIDYSIYYDQQPPDDNLTGETGMIQITRPAMPANAVGWKVYAGGDSGLPSPALLTDLNAGEVNNVVDDSVSAVLFTDINQISAGTPPRVSRTIDGGDNVAAINVDYAGSGALVSGGLGSGTVEEALDTLVGRTARVVTTLNGLYGGVTIAGSGTVSVASAGSTITITGTGGGGGASTYISASGSAAMTGSVSLIGASGITLTQDTAASSITIKGSRVNGIYGDVTIAGSGAVSVASAGSTITITGTGGGGASTYLSASGGTAMTGNVFFVGASGAIVRQDTAASSIIIEGTTVRKSGDSPLWGDVQFAGGTGITVTQNSGASSITIAATGSGPASAGVNSIKLNGEAGVVDGNVILYEGANIDITQSASGFTIAGTATPTVLIGAGSAYAPSANIYGGSGITLRAEASGITINSDPIVRRFSHTVALAGTVAVASGDTDYVPGFWVPAVAAQSIRLISVRTQLNGTSSASIASATILRNGVALASLNDVHITTTAATDTASASVAIADMDKINFRVDLVTGTPKNLSATLVFEETITPS